MSASAVNIADLRDMVAEPDATTYSDTTLARIIETFPLIDADGYEPTDDDWTATYDLNAAAANVWSRKASALASLYDFAADGGSYKRSQAYQNAKSEARRYRAMRAPMSLRVHVDHDFERDMQSTYWETEGASSDLVITAANYDEDDD